ncbi:hypothetical protein ACJRO7_017842 [Eucalyptus globulus]|uniref:ADP-ribosyl cyclase/cyclic ADP-ribose hydrolase n=1 Tax=Eucalyptus globulus TaxID=34317 RepID=A0ABD3KRK1_EUCGL
MNSLAIVLPLAHLSVCAYRFLQKKKSMATQNYDVFLSFRDGDTRTGFTDFLYNSLVAAGVHVFRDDDALPVGKQIGPEILWAIRSCRIAIPIISERYAQSKWCLRELTEIMDCHRHHGKSVFPIFYKVDVVDVGRQRGNFQEALCKHEMQFSTKEVLEWREALTSVARIKGWISETVVNGHEGELVNMVVAKVSSELKTTWIERLPMFPILMSNDYAKSVFNDNDPHLIGKDVAHEIRNAIDHCEISIPIISENYASSPWCLNELAQMVESKRIKGQEILPIFYKVSTSHVRNLSHFFGECMLRHKKLVDTNTYERWEQALREVGSSKGWTTEKIANGHEGLLVKRVVKEVSRLLNNPRTRDPPIPIPKHICRM